MNMTLECRWFCSDVIVNGFRPINACPWPRRTCLRLAHRPSSLALLALVAVILSASAPPPLPFCGLTPLLASLPVWTAVDNFIYLFVLLLMDGCLVPFLFCVDLQLSVASPPTPAPHLEPAPPTLDWLMRLSVAPSSYLWSCILIGSCGCLLCLI